MKIKPSDIVEVRTEDRQFTARIVDIDSDPSCDVLVVDLDDVDTGICIPRSAIVRTLVRY